MIDIKQKFIDFIKKLWKIICRIFKKGVIEEVEDFVEEKTGEKIELD